MLEKRDSVPFTWKACHKSRHIKPLMNTSLIVNMRNRQHFSDANRNVQNVLAYRDTKMARPRSARRFVTANRYQPRPPMRLHFHHHAIMVTPTPSNCVAKSLHLRPPVLHRNRPGEFPDLCSSRFFLFPVRFSSVAQSAVAAICVVFGHRPTVQVDYLCGLCRQMIR